MRLFGIIFAAAGLLFVGFGSYMAHSQRVKLRTYVPVEATILDKRIESSTDSDGDTTYKPVIDFRYVVNNREYQSDQVTPLTVSSSSRSQAQAMLDRFQVRQSTTAYHDPADASEAYLVREATFFPYVFALGPMIFVAVGVGVMLMGESVTPSSHPPRAEEGYYRLRATKSIRSNMFSMAIVSAFWWAVGLTVLMHWQTVGEFTLFPLIALGIYGGLGVIPLVMFGRALAVHQRYGEPTVLVDKATPRRGDFLVIYFEQPTNQPIELDQVTIGLHLKHTFTTGVGKNRSTRTETIYTDDLPVSQPTQSRAGQVLQYHREVTVPQDQPASDVSRFKTRHNWVIHIHTDAASGADYQGEFPILVQT